MELSTTQKSHNPSLLSDFHKFKSLLNENFIALRQVGEYASLMNISTYRLNTVCTSAVRKPAMAIIKERVLIEAKNMVAHTSMNVSEIAYNLNFSDTSNFIKFFKSQTSLTPIEYREKI
ncbi:helix-turn-helix domain-containing protein [Chondrinema litorale]|uniref:helix-turn-helix domain-containing protein n=1 Tax=Chondrinema litorale TaxID=2994555 RepID=UPI002543F047|nr:helix-turn-helix domain-containing protein [Chondrinema litorale]UZR98229.1 helix-turn-helix domain-containing protein [Chondrinema litorale]